MAFAPSQVELHSEDIFVEIQLLSTWLPLDSEIDPYSATLTVSPREPLPIQLRLQRQRRIAKALAYLGLDDPKYPRIDNAYRLWDVPFLDQSVFVASRKEPAGKRLYEEGRSPITLVRPFTLRRQQLSSWHSSSEIGHLAGVHKT